MKIYKLRLPSNDATTFDFVRFSEKNKISTYITYERDDLFGNIIFLIVTVPTESISVFEGKYSKQIVNSEPF